MRVNSPVFWTAAAVFPLISAVAAQHEHHNHDDIEQHIDPVEAALPANDMEMSHSHEPVSHDEHSHNPHQKALEFFNETQVLLSHAPDPLAYWRYDYAKSVQDFPAHLTEEVNRLGIIEENLQSNRHPRLILAHIVLMSLAFLIVLPIGLALRSASHPLHVPITILFLALFSLSILLSSAYAAITPNLYENNVHAKIGWFTVFFVIALYSVEFLGFFRRLIEWVKNTKNEDHEERTIRSFISNVLFAKKKNNSYRDNEDEHNIDFTSSYESIPLASPEETSSPSPPSTSSSAHRISIDTSTRPNVHRHSTAESVMSTRSEDTLHDHASPTSDQHEIKQFSVDSNDSHHNLRTHLSTKKVSMKKKIQIASKYLMIFCLRSLPFLYFIQLQSGVAVYTGSCRGAYLNGCMAHMIKGGIFFLYGLLTWARYMGAWAEYGFAWNKKPYSSSSSSSRRNKVPSFEFLESFVIFLYGCTNTWMERFGAKAGDPYTVKQIQHISIAVMFFGAGAVGILLEWRKARTWLSDNVVAHASRAGLGSVATKSSQFTFNPFPALCIGITGLAMSFHHQTYVFQVSIHQLWGFLLAGFSVMRFLTYFFLHLRPPASIFPSRPPTEALAAFFLTAGGMSFVLSTEQVTFAAMRYGFDDVMAFLNFTASVVACLFALIAIVLAIRGWGAQRMARARDYNHTYHNHNALRVSFAES